MSKSNILKKLAQSLIKGNDEECKKWAQEALNANINAYQALMKGCAKTVGNKFERWKSLSPKF